MVTSRFALLLSIAVVAINSFVLLVYCFVVVGPSVLEALTEASFDVDGARHFAVGLIELADLILPGVRFGVLIGIYQVYVDPDLSVAGWMRVSSLDDWETQILTMIVVLLAVTFLAIATTWIGGQDVTCLGSGERRHPLRQPSHSRPPGQALIPRGYPQTPCGSEAGPAIPACRAKSDRVI